MMASHSRTIRASAQRGFACMWALLAIAAMGIYLTQVGKLWGTEVARANEEILLQQGDEIRNAIKGYVEAGGAGSMQFPRSLNDLVRDPRVPYERRFLRKPYRDPMSGRDWAFIGAPGGGFMGVYSSARGTPFKVDNFPRIYSSFMGQTSYEGWRFAHYPILGGGWRR